MGSKLRGMSRELHHARGVSWTDSRRRWRALQWIRYCANLWGCTLDRARDHLKRHGLLPRAS